MQTRTSMISIDGSAGEGGGQVLRTSLSLSLATGRPFRIEKIRAGRRTPGLLRQHLTAVQAACAISEGSAEGAALGSTDLTFVPGRARSGEYSFAIGTAGSTMLVLQTILIPLMLLEGRSVVRLEGGTHNPASPPFDFLRDAFLPLMRRMGGKAEAKLEREGFYPAGGGAVEVTIEGGATLRPLELLERGQVVKTLARALVCNLSWEIARREIAVVRARTGWPEESLEAHTIKGCGPGNVLTIRLESENVTEVFTGFGEKGVSAERVAEVCVAEMQRYVDSGAAVGEHLADQLLLPLALAGGGAFTASGISAHTRTNAEVIGRLLDIAFSMEPCESGWNIEVASS